MASETYDLLQRLARLYGNVPELVPQGWEFSHDESGHVVQPEAGRGPGIALTNHTGFYSKLLAPPPWFLDLALGRLDCWLEDNGWHVIKQKCGRWCIFRMCSSCIMDHRLEPHGEPEFSSRLEAAISAAEIVVGLEVRMGEAKMAHTGADGYAIPQWKHRSEHTDWFYDGDAYLVAVPLSTGKWDIDKWWCSTDEDTPVSWRDVDGCPPGWDWLDVEFYIHLDKSRWDGKEQQQGGRNEE